MQVINKTRIGALLLSVTLSLVATTASAGNGGPSCRSDSSKCQVARPSLWEFGWGMVRLGEASQLPTTPANLFTSTPVDWLEGTDCSAAVCRTIARRGFIVVADAAKADTVPFSYYNKTGGATCANCGAGKVCVDGVCSSDESAIGSDWDLSNAQLLGNGNDISYDLLDYSDGAYASEIAWIIMGASKSVAVGAKLGSVEIEYVSGPPTSIDLVVGTNIRPSTGTFGVPSESKLIRGSKCNAAAPENCFLDYHRRTLAAADRTRQIMRINVHAVAPIRVHAISLHAADVTVTTVASKAVDHLYQSQCSAAADWGHDLVGGKLYPIACTSGAECDSGACNAGQCQAVWGHTAPFDYVGCTLTSMTMIMNTLGTAPTYLGPAGATAPTIGAWKPGQLNQTMQRAGAFSSYPTGRAIGSLRSQLAFATENCPVKKKVDGTPEKDAQGNDILIPKDSFASAFTATEAQAYCTAMAPILRTWSVKLASGAPKVAAFGDALAVGQYVELLPGDADSKCATGTFNVKCDRSFKDFEPTRVCGTASTLRNKRPVLTTADGEVALLEVEAVHPLRPTANTGCTAAGVVANGPPATWYHSGRHLPCSPGYLARVVYLQKASTLSTGSASNAYGNLQTGTLAKLANMTSDPTEITAAMTPDARAAFIHTLEERVVNGEVGLLRVKNDGHHVVLTGLGTKFRASTLADSSHGMSIPAGGGWFGTFLVNDPQQPNPDSQDGAQPITLFRANQPQGKDWNSIVGYNRFRLSASPDRRGVLTVRTRSPALPVVRDASGNETGWRPNGLGSIASIPGSSLAVVGDDLAESLTDAPTITSDEQYRDISIIQSSFGTLTATFVGTASGSVTLDVVVTDENGGSQTISRTWKTSLNQVVAFSITASAAAGTPVVVTQLTPTDADGDKIATPADCADNDANRRPDAAESCGNGVDDDCDTLVDAADPECSAPVACPDADQDGVADCTVKGCVTTGLTCGDCKDTHAFVRPGILETSRVPELCSDGLDNDCDNKIDSEEVECQQLAYPQVGDLCLFDVQCGPTLFCDNPLGGGSSTFTCQARKSLGATCLKSDACASGQCGLAKCCDDSGGANQCAGIDLALGSHLGSVHLETLLPSGCYTATGLAASDCFGLPFCAYDITACKSGTAWTDVDLNAIADFGPLGLVNVTGQWTDKGWCLEGDAPNTTGLALDLKQLHVKVCETGNTQADLTVDGTTTLSGSPLSFTGKIVKNGLAWTMTLTSDSVKLGGYELKAVTLGLSSATGTVSIDGFLDEPLTGLHARITGDYTEGADATLTLVATNWTPAPGLTFASVTGTLKRTSNVWTATVTVDASVPLGPLTGIAVAGSVTIDSVVGRIVGCFDVKKDAAQGQRDVGLIFSSLTARLCMNTNGIDGLYATVSTSTTIFGGAAKTYSGTLRLGSSWKLDLTLGTLTFGAFTAQSATLFMRGTGTTIASTDLAVSLDFPAASGTPPLKIDGTGKYAASGVMSMAISLRPGTTWSPITGLTFDTLGGKFDRTAAGVWSGNLSIDSSALNVGPISGLRIGGSLVLSPTTASGCLSAYATQDQGSRPLGPFVLKSLRTTLCVNDGATPKTYLTTSGNVFAFGVAPSVAFNGSLTLGPTWSFSLGLTGLKLSGLKVNTARFEGTQVGSSANVTLFANVSLGLGASPLVLDITGAYAPSGTTTLTGTIPAATPWTPMPGLVIKTGTVTITRTAGGGFTATIDGAGSIDLGPLKTVSVAGILTVDTASGGISGSLTLSPKSFTVGGVAFTNLGGTVTFDSAGGTTTASASISGKVSIFGQAATDFTGGVSFASQTVITATVAGLKLGGLKLETGTLTLTGIDPQTATGTFSGILAAQAGSSTLRMSINAGAHSTGSTGTVNLTLTQLGDWTPVPGFTVKLATGTLTRSGSTWSATVSLTADIAVPPFGTVSMQAVNVSLTGDPLTVNGCVKTVANKSYPIGPLTLTDTFVEMCVGTAGVNGAPVLRAGGSAALFGEVATVTYTTSIEVGPPYHLVLKVPQLKLGGTTGFTVTDAEVDLLQNGNNVTAKLTKATAKFGKGAGAATFNFTANYPGNDNADVTMTGTLVGAWKPNANITITAATGTLSRKNKAWSASMSLDTDVALGPLGTVALKATNLTVGNGGADISGEIDIRKGPPNRLQPLTSITIGGVSFAITSAKAKLTTSPTVTNMSFTLESEVELQGGGGGRFVGTITLDSATGWTVAVTATNVKLGAFFMPSATLTIIQPPSGATTTKLTGTVEIGDRSVAGRAVRFEVNGDYKSTGDFDLVLTGQGVWTPTAGVSVNSFNGTLSKRDAGLSATFAVSTTFTFPILGPVTVTGNLTSVTQNDTTRVDGCLEGSLALSKIGLPNTKPTDTAKAGVCFSSATDPAMYFEVSSWAPFPGFALPNVRGDIKKESVGGNPTPVYVLRLTASYPGVESWEAVPGLLFVSKAKATALFAPGGVWEIGASGHTQFSLAGLNFDFDVSGKLDQGQLTLLGTYSGKIGLPGAPAGFPKLVNPGVELLVTFAGGGTVQVRVFGDFVATLLGSTLNFHAEAIATLGESIDLSFIGSLFAPDGPDAGTAPDPVTLGGLPLGSGVCFGMTTGPLLAKCGLENITFGEGFTIAALNDLPFKLTDGQKPVQLVVNIPDLTSITVKATLPLALPIIAPEHKFPGVRLVTLQDLDFTIELKPPPALPTFKAAGSILFGPSNQPNDLTGHAEVDLTPSLVPPLLVTLGGTFFIDGRWEEPFGLPDITIQNPGVTFAVDFNSVPNPPFIVPIPSRIGFGGALFWLKEGDWPEFNFANKEDCGTTKDDDGDGKALCDDPDCVTDLYCVDNVATFEANLLFDKAITESGICLGVCLPLPKLLVDLTVANFGTEDVVRVIEDVRKGAVNVLVSAVPTDVGDKIKQVLGTASLDNLNLSPLDDIHINELKFYLSTHNTELFGRSFSTGLRSVLDVNIGPRNFSLKGSLDAAGLLLEGRTNPFTLLGAQVKGDPFAQLVELGSNGVVKVNNAAGGASLGLAAGGCVEGFVKRASWPTSFATTSLVDKLSGSASGYRVAIGDPVGGKGRIQVTLNTSNGARVVTTDTGVVPANEMVHVAVQLVPTSSTSSNRTVRIYVNGEPVTASQPETNQRGPAENTTDVVIGRGMVAIDDVRFWNKPRTDAQIAGEMNELSLGYPTATELTARYEFDYDDLNTEDAVAHNSKNAGNPKIHGVLDGAARVKADTAGQDIGFKLAVYPTLAGFADSGLTVRGGIDVPNPLSDDNIRAGVNVRIGLFQARGFAYMREFALFDAGPQFGKLVVSGKGPNNLNNDFDDGVYGEFDLFRAELLASSKLFQRVGSTDKTPFADWSVEFLCAPGVDCNPLAPHTLNANGSFDLRADIPIIGRVDLEGDVEINTAIPRASISGELHIFGLELASSIKLDSTKVTLNASIKVPGFTLGACPFCTTIGGGTAKAEMTLDFAARTFCGDGDFVVEDFPGLGNIVCSTSGCIKTTGVDFDFNCDTGVTKACTANNDCASGKFCKFPLCVNKLEDGVLCKSDGQCQSGNCTGRCYTPHSSGQGDACYTSATDHCATGMTCCAAGACNGKCVKLNVALGAVCDTFARCAEGLDCKVPTLSSGPGNPTSSSNGAKKCHKKNLGLGESCLVPNECLAGLVCQSGKCHCDDDADCPSDRYCTNFNLGTCAPRLTSGSCIRDRWCVTNQCNGTTKKSCLAVHSVALGAACELDAECKSDNCSSGLCKCNDDADCPNAAQHCASSACVGAVAEGATCQGDRWCAAGAACLNVSTTATANLRCVTPGALLVAANCSFSAQCKSGLCDKRTATSSQLECKCTSTSDCASNKYCDIGARACVNRKADFEACATPEQCAGNLCVTAKCMTAEARSDGQTCVNASHCKVGLSCLGTCFAPGTRAQGQACTSATHCASGTCVGTGSNKTCGCNPTAPCTTAGQFCNSLTGLCQGKLPGKAQCTISGQPTPSACQSGICRWGLCGCSTAADCPANHFCEDLYCNAKRTNGSACTNVSHCASGKCSSVPTTAAQTCQP